MTQEKSDEKLNFKKLRPRGRGTQLANGRRPTAFAGAGVCWHARPPRVWLAPSA